VNHGRVIDNYRAARDITLRHRRGEASTEDLRQAMVYFRALFVDLLEPDEAERATTDRVADRVADRVVDRPVERDDLPERTARSTDHRHFDDREVNP
jgi:hypothetical protein